MPGLGRWGNRAAVSGHGHRRRRRWRAGEHQAPSHVRPVLSCTPRSVLGIEFFVKPATIANLAFVSGDLNEITTTLAWFELLSPGRGGAAPPLSLVLACNQCKKKSSKYRVELFLCGEHCELNKDVTNTCTSADSPAPHGPISPFPLWSV